MFLTLEKLPRGSFYYIKIGHKFYGGEQPNFLMTSSSKYVDHLTLNEYNIKFPKKKKKKYDSGIRTRTYKQLIGHTSILVDDFINSKRFRRLKQAQNACNSLTKAYNGIATPTIEIYDEREY